MKKILLVCLLFCSIPVFSFAEYGQRFSIDGYSLHIAATQLSDSLVVSGDVKGGDPCKQINVYVSLSDDKGHSTSVSGIIKNYRYSGKFTIKKKYPNGGYWTVKRVSVFK